MTIKRFSCSKTRLGFMAMALSLALSSMPSYALTVTTTADANTLASTILGSGISLVGSATYTGGAVASGTFTGGLASGIGIDSGIILTSGAAQIAVGPNTSDSASQNNLLPGSPVLDSLVPGYTTQDATLLTFSFTSTGGNLFFNYAFGSEEYNEWVGSSFNDVFGFFVDGNNIALLPGTTTPVAINNVNNGANSSYYIDNTSGTHNVQYDGFTTVLTANVLGLSAGTHTITLAIGDAGDGILDSGVFIQGGSFSDTPTPPQGVPEPSTLLLLGAGLAGLGIWRRKASNI